MVSAIKIQKVAYVLHMVYACRYLSCVNIQLPLPCHHAHKPYVGIIRHREWHRFLGKLIRNLLKTNEQRTALFLSAEAAVLCG